MLIDEFIPLWQFYFLNRKVLLRGGTKRMATFNDAIESLNAKRALVDQFQVCQATLGICSLVDVNVKPTFVSPYFNAVKAFLKFKCKRCISIELFCVWAHT